MEAPGGKGASVVTDKNRQKFQEGMVSMKNIELKNIFRSKYVIRVAAGIVTVAVIGSSVGASVYTVRAGQQAVSQGTSGSAWERRGTCAGKGNAGKSPVCRGRKPGGRKRGNRLCSSQPRRLCKKRNCKRMAEKQGRLRDAYRQFRLKRD